MTYILIVYIVPHKVVCIVTIVKRLLCLTDYLYDILNTIKYCEQSMFCMT